MEWVLFDVRVAGRLHGLHSPGGGPGATAPPSALCQGGPDRGRPSHPERAVPF